MSNSLRKLIPAVVRGDLKTVESRLKEVVAVSPSVRKPAAQILAAGGKRLRPALLLLCANGNVPGADSEVDPIASACAVELIHMGSLVHDDIVDENPFRRGERTIADKWGTPTAVAVGDFLFSQAFALLASYQDSRPAQILAETVCEMGSGELEQLAAIDTKDTSIDAYDSKIWKKTAVLFASSCDMGAICAGFDERDRADLRKYGEELGMAFQVFDDILDFTGNEKELGKPQGTDVKEGNITLPMIYSIENGNELLKESIGSKDAEKVAAAVKSVQDDSEALERTRTTAANHVTSAKEVVGGLADEVLSKTLSDLADYVIERNN